MWFKKRRLSSEERGKIELKGLLCFDFDGTLVDTTEEPRFHPLLTDRLRQLEEAGFMWAIVTGRALEQTLEALGRYGVNRVPHFVIAGEYEIFCRTPGGQWIDLQPWNKIMRKQQRMFLRKHKTIFKRWQPELPTVAEAELFMRRDTAGVVATRGGQMDQVCAWLEQKRQAEAPALGFQRNGRFLRFTLEGLGKGRAVVELGQRLGVTLGRTFVAGDNHNDLSMLEIPAGFAACPANAVDEVRLAVERRGGFVAGERASGGMIQALEHFFADELRSGALVEHPMVEPPTGAT